MIEKPFIGFVGPEKMNFQPSARTLHIHRVGVLSMDPEFTVLNLQDGLVLTQLRDKIRSVVREHPLLKVLAATGDISNPDQLHSVNIENDLVAKISKNIAQATINYTHNNRQAWGAPIQII